MFMKKCIFLIILIFSVEIASDNKKYIFDQLGRRNGLSNSSVSSIVQDKDGFLWFGTQGGLNRFDGKNFKIYEHNPYDINSLPHRLIQTMYLDYEKNVLWIGTYDGLAKFDISTENFTAYRHIANDKTSLSNEVVTSIAKDMDGNIWVGTLNGLNCLNVETGKFKSYFKLENDENSISSNVIRSILFDSKGRLWIGGYEGLNLYDFKKDNFIRYPYGKRNTLPGQYVMSMNEDDEGIIWIANWGKGIVKFEPDYNQFELIVTEDTKIYTVMSDNAGHVWAGSWGGGLFDYDIDLNKVSRYVYDESNSGAISHDVVYSLFADNSGILWIGTNGNGICKLNKNKKDYRKFYYNPGNPLSLTRGKINSILEDSRGDVWIGVYSGGLNRYIKSQKKVVHYRHNPYNKSSLSNDIVTFVYEDSNGNIWIGTNIGLNRFIRSSNTFRRYKFDGENGALSGSIPYAMVEDADGSLWIGTYKNGIDHWDIKTNKITNYRLDPNDLKSISDNLIYYIIKDSDNDIWIATNNGLNRFNREDNNFERFMHDPGNKNSLSNNTIRVIMEDSDGLIWIGTTSGGLNSYNKKTGKFEHYDKSNGMSDNSVYSILEDVKGNLWISTSYGINILNKKTSTFTILTEDDGLWGMEFNVGHCKGKDGALYFGSMHGVYEFNYSPKISDDNIPPVKIVDIKIMNKSLKSDRPYYLLDEIRLPYNKNFLSFEFVGIDYISPKKNEYAYKLNNVNKDWIYTGNRNYISFSNLQSGKYTLQVKAANSHGVWNEEGASLKIIIDPPPWKTWWAYAIYVLGGISLMYLVAEIRTKRALEYKIEELEDTRTKLQNVNKQLEGISVKDSLTDVFNRRYMDKKFEAEWNHAINVQSRIGLIIIDIDFFKRYNDHYGHQAGDEVLFTVAKTLESIPGRQSDFVCRYGGEEFCIILPEVSENGIEAIAEKCLQAVRALRLKHEYSNAADVLTISLGFGSVIPNGEIKSADFFKQVDDALYRAKDSGRNMAVLADIKASID